MAPNKATRRINIEDNGPEGIIRELELVDGSIQEVGVKADKAISIAEETKKMEGPVGPIGLTGEKGDKGDTGESIIGPQGPIGPSGESIVGPRGLSGFDGKDGKDGSPDSAEDIADKLNTLKEVIDVTVIKGAVAREEFDFHGKKILDGMALVDGRIKAIDQRWGGRGGGGSKSPLTTKGDIFGFSTINDRIPVGTNGKVLTADSTNPLGVAWSALPSTSVTTDTTLTGDGTVITPLGLNLAHSNDWTGQQYFGQYLATIGDSNISTPYSMIDVQTQAGGAGNGTVVADSTGGDPSIYFNNVSASGNFQWYIGDFNTDLAQLDSNGFNLFQGIYQGNGSGLNFHVGGVPPGTTNADVGGIGIEMSGSDNTTGGMNLILSNSNAGTSAFVDIFFQNDLADASGAHFAVINYNSSTYSDTTFGSLLSQPNQLAMYGTDGPTLIGSANTTTRGYVSFFAGGTNLSHERMRILNTGQIGINTTTPTSTLQMLGVAGIDILGFELPTTSLQSIIPFMVSNTSPNGTAFDSAGQVVWELFNGDVVNYKYDISVTSQFPYIFGYQFPFAKTVTKYQFWTRPGLPERSPKTWTFQGSNNGSSWTTLDTQTNVLTASWSATGNLSFTFSNSTAYLYYRMNITVCNDPNYFDPIQLRMYATVNDPGVFVDAIGRAGFGTRQLSAAVNSQNLALFPKSGQVGIDVQMPDSSTTRVFNARGVDGQPRVWVSTPNGTDGSINISGTTDAPYGGMQLIFQESDREFYFRPSYNMRIHFGNSGNPVYSLNFDYVSQFEGVPGEVRMKQDNSLYAMNPYYGSAVMAGNDGSGVLGLIGGSGIAGYGNPGANHRSLYYRPFAKDGDSINTKSAVYLYDTYNAAADLTTFNHTDWAVNGGVVASLAINGDFTPANLKIGTVGKGIYVKEGTNATMGQATLSGGTVVVSTTKVTANSRIFLTIDGGTLTNVGATYVSARTAGTSFTISSSNILDASNVSWIIIEPA